MPSHEDEYPFSAKADGDGVIRADKEQDLPFSGRLRELRLWTTSGCNGRSHQLTLVLTNRGRETTLFKGAVFHDCNRDEIWWAQPIKLESGSSKIHIEATGFNPHEDVTGACWVKASTP